MNFCPRTSLPVTLLAVALAAVIAAAGGERTGERGAAAPAVAPGSPPAGALVAAVRVQHRAAAAPCGSSGMVCSSVVVPLDRSGRVPGTITLHVESLPAVGAERGVMMLVAGGPGQASARVYDIGAKDNADLFHALFPGYRIVAFDNRGTGQSGLLDCPALQTSAATFDGQEKTAAACAAVIGPRRDFYSTRDHADDTDAVRVALGVDKIAMWGTSYGTKLELAYALTYPTHVDRLLLDSVLPTDYPEPFEANVLHDMPAALTAFCGPSACRGATPSYAADVAAVANALARKSARGKVRQASGSSRTVTMGGPEMLALVVDSDLNPGIAAVLPAATRAARNGNPAPLLRLYDLDVRGEGFSAEDLSFALNAATTCADGHFPWDASTPVGDRPAKLKAAVAALPAGALGPFGPWAIALGSAAFCLNWPSPAVPTPALGSGPLPDVPVLAVSGAYDIRTPTSSASAIVRSFPHSNLLVVPAVGHSVVTADPSYCAIRAVRAWIENQRVPASCARPSFLVKPVPAYPSTAAPSRAASPLATLAIVRRTLADAEGMWLATALGSGTPVAGVTSGSLTAGTDRLLQLRRYGIAPGVEVSGRLSAKDSGYPLAFTGTVTVTGAGAAHGRLQVKGDVVTGTLLPAR